jgi:thiol:disulfide interchange protein DsbD
MAQPLTGAVVQTPQVRAELVAYAPQGVQAGTPLWMGLQLTHQPEWHTYWRNPGDSGLPTQIEFNLPAGVQAGNTLWPLPHKLRAGSLTNYGFDNTVLLSTPLTVSRTFKPSAKQTLDVQVHASWLVCRLECIPQEGDFALSIPVNSSTGQQAAAFDAVLAQQPKTLPSLKTSASFEGQKLVVQVSGLPKEWQGKEQGQEQGRAQRLSVFPETAELLEASTDQHPQATQTWQGDTWTAQIPLSAMRSETPKRLELLLVAELSQELRQGIRVPLSLTQAWPAVEKVSHETSVASATPINATSTSVNSRAFLLAVAGAFLGGLILNLMPCVLPVLAIKLLGFAQHSRQHRAHRIAGLAYTTGVVLSFLLLGSGVLALRAAGEQLGWGFQLQSPTVVSALALLFTLIALNLFGLFELGHVLPSRLMSFQAKHPVFDALLSGVLAVAVASPCTAPFMGASLGLAMTLPTWQALFIFAAMGLGLAAPYLLASLVPAVVKLLPHPGPWMLVLRQFLALPMLATVLWLLWVLGQQTSFDLAMLAVSGLLLMAAFIWCRRWRTRTARFLQGLLGLALLTGSVAFVRAINDSAFMQATPNLGQLQIDPTRQSEHWQPWSEAAVAQALAQNRTVFVDFTAAWCVTCQINKKTTLTNTEVMADFERHQVVLMRADWTRRDPAITAALTALGRSGVPVYVIYAPGRSPMVLSELLSASQIHDALNVTKNDSKNEVRNDLRKPTR